MAQQRQIREWTNDCKINLHGGDSCGGVAHVLEVVYDADFTAWFGRVKLNAPADFSKIKPGHGIGIFFEDGRGGHARLLSMNFVEKGQLPPNLPPEVRAKLPPPVRDEDVGAFFHFVGASNLEKPKAGTP